MDNELPKFVILGGCGFIGRHLVEYLLSRSSRIFVIDKTPPEIAWLNDAHAAAFRDPKVVFQSANLITQNGCEKAFGNINEDVDYIINLASETRSGQSEGVYKDGIYKLTSNVTQHVADKFGSKIKLYIEFSSGVLYPKDKSPHSEEAKVDTWNYEAKYKYQAEQQVAKSLKKYIIIRPAIVYGVGDRNGITPRLVVGAIYKHLNEMMKLPWTAELKTHTVHIEDLVRATYFLCLNGKAGQIYNIVDEGDTTQGYLTEIISDIFNINHDYWGTTFSTLAKLDMNDVIEEINDKHLGPWATVCSSNGVANTPLSPYIHSDSLSKRHLAMDGKKLRETGFKELVHPVVSKELLLDVLEDFVQLNLFPKTLLHS
jgi:nucleoside-diphosphate-sugar epimerase